MPELLTDKEFSFPAILTLTFGIEAVAEASHE